MKKQVTSGAKSEGKIVTVVAESKIKNEVIKLFHSNNVPFTTRDGFQKYNKNKIMAIFLNNMTLLHIIITALYYIN